MRSVSHALSALPLGLAAMTMAAGACGAFDGRERLAPPVAQAAIPLPDPAPAKADIARADDGLFYVHAMINGRRVRFLVDTGASVVVLTAADAAAVGASPAKAAFGHGLRTVGGQAAMAWTSLDEVKVGERRVRSVRAAVVRQGLGVSLLGQNLLSRLGPIRIDGDQLTIG